jgi:hypothetical protein
MRTSYYFISNYMNKKWFCLFALLFIGNLSFGQTFLFKYNTGIPYRASGWQQMCEARYISMGAGSTPSWITLNISSVETSKVSTGPNEGKFLVFNQQGTLYLNVAYSTLGAAFIPVFLTSPTGSFVLSGTTWTNSASVTKHSFYKYNSSSRSWSLSSALPTTNSPNISYVYGQAGTQANCALWCSLQNEGGNLVAYVYSY